MFGRGTGILFLLSIILVAGCREEQQGPALFDTLTYRATGLDFTNKLTPDDSFNVFHYMYFYNGAGIGAGDFNNDGLIDLYFASNQGEDKLYLNQGNLRFKDVSNTAQLPSDRGWSTGVSVVDINNDGLLDIYVCRVSNYETLQGSNQFLICTGLDAQGIPTYVDRAPEMGLDFAGFSTQAAFFDYDNDGDLDMFLLDHSVHEKGVFRARATFSKEETVGDRIYRNDDLKFTDVTAATGIYSSPIGYGLGVAIADINLDGYSDIYVGNDFHENDYLYINNGKGGFTEEINNCMMHTSQFSMGVDIADINNDGLSDIISMDMLPSDPYILKRSLGEDEYDIFQLKLKSGYNYQYTRNNLQLNRGNGKFSEVGLFSGIAATDWSWAALWLDFDNDGWKDLFVSNGIPKRMNDIDYINFISNGEIQQKIRARAIHEKDIALIDKFPQIKIPNRFFHNNGALQFNDLNGQVRNNRSTYSNGAVYADFDNDGDLDIVVNNIDEPALLYRNNTNDTAGQYLSVKLTGTAMNRNAIGAKLVLYTNNGLRLYEKSPVHGFLSSMEGPVHIGLKNTRIDSMFVIWPDNSYTQVQQPLPASELAVQWQPGLPAFDYASIKDYHRRIPVTFTNITASARLDYVHKENPFPEFNREPLIPHMLSAEGPAMAIADINRDGLDDVFIGAAKWEKNAVYIQQRNGQFTRTIQPALEADSTWEDVSACWTDVNNDSYPDLVVASGGNEFYGNDIHLTPRLYLNDGQGRFTKKANAFEAIFVNASVVISYDFNGDGYADLFLGGRCVPWNYGEAPRSYLLLNDGKGNFKDVTEQIAPDLPYVGFVKHAQWIDLDNDKDNDLVLAMEWDGITAFINNEGYFKKVHLTDKKGWWNFIYPVDINLDGQIDLVAGNLGLNSRLTASAQQPVRFYYNDFDDNGKKEQVITYYLNGQEIPFANKAELEKQMPVLKKKYLHAEDFAKATLPELFSEKKLAAAVQFSADYFSNAVLINKGNFNFELYALPWAAQLSPYKCATMLYADNDSLPDLLLAGNAYENNMEMGRYDADFGTLLLNKGNGNFVAAPLSGQVIEGQVRHMQPIRIGKQDAIILARNNDSVMVLGWQKMQHTP
jgi:hypothetical protein